MMMTGGKKNKLSTKECETCFKLIRTRLLHIAEMENENK